MQLKKIKMRKREWYRRALCDIIRRCKMEKKEIEFELKRETKNTNRFQENNTGSTVIDTLYAQKSVLRSKESKKLRVRVEWE